MAEPVQSPEVVLFEYGDGALTETRFASIEAGLAYQSRAPVRWLNVYGVADAATMRAIGERFGLHPLVEEDILNARQRPKVEAYDGYLFLSTRVFSERDASTRLHYEHVSLVVGRDFVLSFQPHPLGVFTQLRERLRRGDGLLAARGADFLAYALIDAIIDAYFDVLDAFTSRVEALDRQLVADRSTLVLRGIHRLKHDAIRLRRALLPLREMLAQMTRGEHALFGDETRLWLRDAYDHCLHLGESLDAARDMVSGMLDLYLSIQSNRLNQQMRVLTIISIVFMPLTLIAGIYGMNFEYMPELGWRWGYFGVLGLMGGIAAAIVGVFWRRRWL
ncbi:magnesium/cobalt transporter CorA [Crenobacter caeni]|uniref:Magnesium transport protein CorA n=1 Tax=Crenobacter caeni TaxID=2705474 RepID=A0A6B2KNK9_9NEIS|nr:magnesium/cobalt transporter CorA [Crenobacter caeni]NDV11754.1 magnesium/cobalt transporter CorA [Crenobacter caeni]